MLFSSNEIGLLCFLSLALALSACYPRQCRHWNQVERKNRLCCCPGGYAPKLAGTWNAKFCMKGWTYVPTIFSESKFLGYIDNPIFLPMLLHCAPARAPLWSLLFQIISPPFWTVLGVWGQTRLKKSCKVWGLQRGKGSRQSRIL